MSSESVKRDIHGSGSEENPDSLAFEILRLCSRTELTAEITENISELVQIGPDWERLMQLSKYHGTRALLMRSLDASCPDLLPEHVTTLFADTHRTSSVFTLFMIQELIRVVEKLQAEGIRSLVLKGPALGIMAFGNVNLRPFVDLDILVSPPDYTHTVEILTDEGYSYSGRVATFSSFKRKIYLWKTRQIPLNRGAYIFNLDLHTAVMPPLYSNSFSFEELCTRSEFLPIGDTTLPCCGAEDTLRILCYHGAKNRWERLKYICDVTQLVRARNGLNWDALLRTARAANEERIFLLGLCLAQIVLDAEIPAPVEELLLSNVYVRHMANQIAERLPHRIQRGTESFGSRLKFQLSVQDSFLSKARYSQVALIRRLLDLVYV